MIDAAIKKFNEFVTNHCTRKGKELGVVHTDVQIRFSFKNPDTQEEEIEYAIYREYEKFVEYTDFDKIMNLKFGFDVLNYGGTVPPILHRCLHGICDTHGITHDNVAVLMSPAGAGQVMAHIYNDTEYKTSMHVKELVTTFLQV